MAKDKEAPKAPEPKPKPEPPSTVQLNDEDWGKHTDENSGFLLFGVECAPYAGVVCCCRDECDAIAKFKAYHNILDPLKFNPTVEVM